MIGLAFQLTYALVTIFPGAVATAASAPSLIIPAVPPARQGCAGAWQVARRVAGFDGGAAYLIEADYDSANGSGRLQRRALNGMNDGSDLGGAGTGAGVSVGALAWDAGALLDGGAGSAGSGPAVRRIFTMSAAGVTLPFEWDRLDGAQRAVLDADGAGEARVAYLRGDRSREGGLFRKRASLLGAIVHGAPLLVGAPAANSAAAASPGYAEFFQRYRNRPKILYAGANDGMLHGFDWNDGTERFAYIPATLLPPLSRLGDKVAAPPAGSGADAGAGVGVDAAPGSGEALIGGRWRSILASGMGMSARGLFALDITDPAQDPLVLWEFGERDDAAAGFIQAAPIIVKLRSAGGRAGGGGAPGYRYFALVSNGFNAADGGADGVLFLLALDKPVGAPWRQGENYYKLRAPAREPQSANALAPPVVTVDADGSAHSAYAGDLQGSMWRFDLRAAASGAAASELFRARDADGAPQPIADAAQVVFAPGGGYVVLFGTGRAIEAGDLQPSSFVQQSMYAVRDTDTRPPAPVIGRAALAARSARGAGTADGFAVAGERFDYNGTGAGVKQGWYLDYPRALQDGERNAAAPMLAGAAVVFSGSAPGADHCAPAVRTYVIDSLTGMAYDRRGLPALGTIGGDPGGAPGSAVTGRRFTASDGVLPMLISRVESGDAAAMPIGVSRRLRRLALYQLPPDGAAPAPALDRVVVATVAGRLSWREIVNWRELHDAAAGATATNSSP